MRLVKFVIHNDDSHEDKCIRIITDDGMGYVEIWYYPEEKESWISDLSVHKSKRRHGYGTALIKKAEEIARTFDIKQIMISAEKDSWMVDWYERLGYKFYDTAEESLINLCKEI